MKIFLELKFHVKDKLLEKLVLTSFCYFLLTNVFMEKFIQTHQWRCKEWNTCTLTF